MMQVAPEPAQKSKGLYENKDIKDLIKESQGKTQIWNGTNVRYLANPTNSNVYTANSLGFT